jgi:CSLREA domain-containing protein
MSRFGLLFSLMLVSGSASAATFTVNSIFDTADTNPGDNICEATSGGVQCTLRAAIEEANAQLGHDTIEFSLGLIVISISSTPLPTITSFLTIDGTTAPNYNAAATSVTDAPPSVYLSGSSLTGTTADGLRFGNGSGAATVKGIGIINFPDNGIEVVTTSVIKIDSNWIGMGRTGGIDGNGGAGVYLNQCERCEVGQTLSSQAPNVRGRGNLISNNAEDGVYVIDGEDNLIAGNYIGFDPFNDADRGNGGHGIYLIGPDNMVGTILGIQGGVVEAPNVIKFNNGNGVHTQLGGQLIYANSISSNAGHGVVLHGSGSNLGFTNPAMSNDIFSNDGHGVVIGDDFASPSNLVQGNRIYANASRGVHISAGANNVITQNRIFDNTNDAVRLDAGANTVSGNGIGVDGNTLEGNGFNGVVINSGGNTVSNNTIAGLGDDGIDLVTGDGNQITGNGLGTHSSGLDWGNGGTGIRVRAAATNTLISNNSIGNNTQDGVLLEGGGSRLCGNRIGLTSGLLAAGNNTRGVRILGNNNLVGGVGLSCAANDIGNNILDGVHIEGDANVVHDNNIGQEGLTLFGNGASGVLLTNTASDNNIGGNLFGDNNGDAVRLINTAGTRNRIQENEYKLNGTTSGDLAIDLLSNGATANDANDADAGANNIQNTPELLVVQASSNELEITYRMTSSIANSTYPITVDFYRGENRSLGPSLSHIVEGVLVFRDTYNLAPNTNKVIAFDPLFDGGQILAQATDAEGNTSEFSVPVSFSLAEQPEVIFEDSFE